MSLTVPLPYTLTNWSDGFGTQVRKNFDWLGSQYGSSSLGFLQSGTGAVERPVESKLRESATPEDFGAAGDGITLDDAALVSWQASGVPNLVGSGATYAVSAQFVHSVQSSIDWRGSTLKWVGSAPGTSSYMYKLGNASATTQAQCEGFGLSNLVLDAQGKTNLNGFYFTTCRKANFFSLYAKSCSATGAAGFTFSGDDSSSLNFAENTLNHLVTEACETGIVLTGTTGFTTDNTFHGIHLFDGSGVMQRGIVFKQNCDTNYMYGVDMTSTYSGTFYGVTFNAGTNPNTQDNDVNAEYISGISVVGGSGGGTAIYFAYSNNIIVDGLRVSSSGGTMGDIFVAGPSTVVSYEVRKIWDPFVTYKAGPLPTVTMGAAAGTSPPSAVVSGSSYEGIITFGTGTGAASGTLLTCTFPVALRTAPQAVLITPINGATLSLGIEPTGLVSASFNIFTGGTPASSQPNTTYGFAYKVIP